MRGIQFPHGTRRELEVHGHFGDVGRGIIEIAQIERVGSLCNKIATTKRAWLFYAG